MERTDFALQERLLVRKQSNLSLTEIKATELAETAVRFAGLSRLSYWVADDEFASWELVERLGVPA